MIFPWQIDQWQQLWRAKQENHLPHALLFTGITGTGKTIFADNFSHSLLCQQIQVDGTHCGACHSCRLVTGRAHPNVLWIEPEKEGQAIKVDQIRDVSEFINQSSFQGEYRIVIIHPADNMNTNAANALLKTLEEPSSGSVIVLISSQPSHLPATILSRCQRIIFPCPKKQLALDWLKSKLSDNTLDLTLVLKLADGAPLAAERLVQDEMLSLRHDLFNGLYLLSQHKTDPIKLAAKIQDVSPERILDFIQSWVMDLLRLQLGGNAEVITNHDYEKQLLELTRLNDVQSNTKLMEHLQQLRGQVNEGINFNKQLLIESVLFKCIASMKCKT